MRIQLAHGALRPWREGDEASLARHANDRDVWRNLRDAFPHPYTVDDGRAWIAEARAEAPVRSFAIEIGGEAVGGIGLVLQPDIFRRSAEVGFWLGREHWGRGIATEALSAFSQYAFATFDIVRLYGGVLAWNPASARVLEKAGYAFEGRLRAAVFKDGEVVDELIFGRVRG